jgi:hypothetical protein
MGHLIDRVSQPFGMETWPFLAVSIPGDSEVIALPGQHTSHLRMSSAYSCRTWCNAFGLAYPNSESFPFQVSRTLVTVTVGHQKGPSQ